VQGWRITGAGKVVLALLALCAIVSIFAPVFIGDIAGAVFLIVLMGVLMNTFVGRTMSTMSESERTQFFQRMYQPRKRWRD
jgi:UPF0716 family protein affecting phage T7 exclusion